MSKPVKKIDTPMRLTYEFTPGAHGSAFLKAIGQGRIIGHRCPNCTKVYVPSRGSCPMCAVETPEEVEVSDKGTITSFSIVRVPSEGIDIELPFACLTIVLDGSDIQFFAVAGEVDVEEIRMGMRVEAVWVDEADLRPSMESIRYFRPTGEPDVPFEDIEEYL